MKKVNHKRFTFYFGYTYFLINLSIPKINFKPKSNGNRTFFYQK